MAARAERVIRLRGIDHVCLLVDDVDRGAPCAGRASSG